MSANPGLSLRTLGLTAALVTTAGCGHPARLDWFLYVPTRVDAYRLDPNGPTPETTVLPEQIEELTVRTDDGVDLGAVWLHTTTQPSLGTVLFFHGKGGNLDTAFDRLKRWSNLGYEAVGFDYRGFGRSSDVEISEPGLDLDGFAMVRAVKARTGTLDRVFYAGQSLGCAPAAQRSIREPSAALIIESGFASLAAFKDDSTQMDWPQQFITDDRWDTTAALRALTIPVLILHGDQDETIRPYHAFLNNAAAHDPKQFVLVEGGGHSNLPEVMGQGYADLMHSFIGQWIPPPR
jgi:pimeloyl-ACP methyl ester carboxylesterase